jgi:putative membrane protein
MSRFERTLLSLLAIVVMVSCVGAPFPQQMYLQHLPTLAAIVLLVGAARRRFFSAAAFTCIIAFLVLHVIGARYIYSYVPYDVWSERIFGFNVTEAFEFRRNHFDRLVHFAFGMLSVRPVWEVLTRRFKVPPRFAFYASVEFVLAFSLVYELFEWGLTMILSPTDAGAYNGEQGDIWDAHRDMSFALLGSVLALIAWRMTTWAAERRDARAAPRP